MRAYGQTQTGQVFSFTNRKPPTGAMVNAFINELTSEYQQVRQVEQRSFRTEPQAKTWLRSQWGTMNLKVVPNQF